MKNLTETISSANIFRGLDSGQLQQLQQIAVQKTVQKGEFVFFDGDPGDGFYLLIDGQIKIFKASPDGKEKILHVFGSGEIFGEIPVFSNHPFPANAQAIKRCRLLLFPKDAFVGLITQNPSLALNMLAELSIRLKEFVNQIEQLSLKDVSARLASYLLYQLEKTETEDKTVKLPMSKGRLSSLLGTIPETLSRIFARLAEQDLIRVRGNSVRILDSARLHELAVYGRSAANNNS